MQLKFRVLRNTISPRFYNMQGCFPPPPPDLGRRHREEVEGPAWEVKWSGSTPNSMQSGWVSGRWPRVWVWMTGKLLMSSTQVGGGWEGGQDSKGRMLHCSRHRVLSISALAGCVEMPGSPCPWLSVELLVPTSRLSGVPWSEWSPKASGLQAFISWSAAGFGYNK